MMSECLNTCQKLCTMLAIVVDCIHSERVRGRLDPVWDLSGLDHLVKELDMGVEVLQVLHH